MPGHETLMPPPEYCHEGEQYVGVKKQPTVLTQEVVDQLSEDQQVRLFKTYPWLKVNGSAIAGTKADDNISRGSFIATQSQTYAKRVRDLNMSEPVGDLPVKIVDRVMPKHPEQRNLAVLLYIQRGVEDRLPLAEGEFKKSGPWSKLLMPKNALGSRAHQPLLENLDPKAAADYSAWGMKPVLCGSRTRSLNSRSKASATESGDRVKTPPGLSQS